MAVSIKPYHRIVSVLMVIIIIASFMFIIPVHAHAFLAAAEVAAEFGPEIVAFFVFVLGLLGIQFASKGEEVEAIGVMLEENPSLVEAFEDVPVTVGAGGNMSLAMGSIAKSQQSYSNFMTIIHTVADWFGTLSNSASDLITKYTGGGVLAVEAVAAGEFLYYDNIKFTDIAAFSSAEECFSYCPYSINDNTDDVSITLNDKTWHYTVDVITNEYTTNYYLKLNGNGITNDYPNYNSFMIIGGYLSNFSKFIDFRYGFRLITQTIQGVTAAYLIPMISYIWQNTSGQQFYGYNAGNIPVADNYNGMPVYDVGVVQNTENAEYDYTQELPDGITLDMLIAAIGAAIGSYGQAESIPLDEEQQDVQEGTDPDTRGLDLAATAAAIWAILNIDGLLDKLKQGTDPTDPEPSQEPTVDLIPPFLPSWTTHVTEFISASLIWVSLWLNGFHALPNSLQTALWALMVILIIIGLLGVLLQ